jgi:hypothetical protein
LALIFENLFPIRPYAENCRTFEIDDVIDANFSSFSARLKLVMSTNTNGKEFSINPKFDRYSLQSIISWAFDVWKFL